MTWAAKAAKVRYSWKVGNGKKVMFWEDVWFGHCSLAIVFWYLDVIDNEQHCTIDSVRDGVDLKITFRRTVSSDLYNRWLDLVNLVASITFFEDGDALVWMFHLSGIYFAATPAPGYLRLPPTPRPMLRSMVAWAPRRSSS